MNFVKFESATEKERLRNELRSVREELLAKAKKDAETRFKREVTKKLDGEDSWIHPSLNKKIEKLIKEHKNKSKKKNKEKKTRKRSKKELKKKRKRTYSSSNSSTSESSSTEEEIVKKKGKKEQKVSTSESSDSLSSESEDQWVEKEVKISTTEAVETQPSTRNVTRDEWMTSGQLFLKTFSKENSSSEKKEKNTIDSYDPSKCSRELNPYWKDGGKGLPSFQKPKDDGDYKNSKYSSYSKKTSGNWRKDNETCTRTSRDYSRENTTREDEYNSMKSRKRRSKSGESNSNSNRESLSERSEKEDGSGGFLTRDQMNALAAKYLKAELMGNNELAKEFKDKLEKAREIRKNIKEQPGSSQSISLKQKHNSPKEEHILLTTTNSKSMTKPLSSHHPLSHDPYGRKGNKRKQKSETHVDGERVRFFPDDDRYDIKQMFEREKYTTASDSDAQFAEIAGKHKNPKDDLEDIFADKVRKNISDYDRDEKEKQRAIAEHERYTKVLESCERCFESPKMEKSLMVAMGLTSYLSIPSYEGLQPGHCLIVPMQHITCSTQLDEDTWNEITEFRKALTRMFASKSQDVIFFEIANYLHKKPHMEIHCIPNANFELAPMYFKKAIQESEYEWSTNKQLVTLKEKDLRRSIPKGLPYFWVHFGMNLGFAHVIEDQHKFKPNFAQEIIGGLLNLDPKSWRKPRKEHNFKEKIKQLAEMWKPYDFTSPV